MPGTTSELYTEQSEVGSAGHASALGQPPAPPSPVPAPTQPVKVTEPVVTKARMADEGPDGRVRDTSTEALRPGNDLGFRNITDESENAPKPNPEETAPAAETKPVEAPKPPEPAPVEKVYAGKFKSAEELERGYLEAQKAMSQAQQKAAELERKLATTPPHAPPAPTPAEQAAAEARKAQFLEQFVADPEKVIGDYQRRAVEQTQVALAAQEVRQNWLKNNPDLAKSVEIEGRTVSGEDFVAFEATRLAQADPELARQPDALIQRATQVVRGYFGAIRKEGATEALTIETRVTPLLGNTTSASSEQPANQGKAPLNFDEAYNAHMKMLKDQESKSHRGLRR